LGSAVVLAYAGSAARAAARAARGVALEVERQLRGFAREHGLAQVPADYTPSYRACIDVTARAALERLLMPVIVTLLLPVLLGFALHVTYRNTEPGLVTQGLTAFVIVASVTGFGAALAVDGAHATFGAARRASRPRGVGSGFAASVGADAVGDVLGNSSGPAAHLLFKGAAVTALLVAPFFTS
jgi:K(+)-stimulated pyrophosphate-energized sodium pump